MRVCVTVHPTPTADGSLTVTSRVDPLFLLLPALEAASQCLSPLSTLLSYAKCPAVTTVVQHCSVGTSILAAVCDVDGASPCAIPRACALCCLWRMACLHTLRLLYVQPS